MSTDLFEQKMRALDRALPRAGAALVKDLAGEWAWWVSLTAPRDTNRFANGWAAAAAAAGLDKGAMLRPLEKSSNYTYQITRLQRLVDRASRDLAAARSSYLYWSKLYNRRYVQTGRKGAWEKQARAKVAEKARQVEKQEKVLARAREALNQLYGTETAIVIGGRGLRKAPPKVARDDGAIALPTPPPSAALAPVRRSGRTFEQSAAGYLKLSNLSRVITRVYGGGGYVADMGAGSRVILHNLEPHASIVEARTGVGKRSREIVRQASGGMLRGQFKSGRAILLNESQLRGRSAL